MLKQARVDFYTSKIESYGSDQKSLHRITKTLLGNTNEVILPLHSSPKQLAQNFSDFFIGKIENIRDNITSQKQSSSGVGDIEADYIGVKYDKFTPTSEDEVKSIIRKSASKSCELDPIPTWLLKECLDELTPVMTKVINASLQSGYVPRSFKHSRIRPLLKKPSLDANVLKNYRPVSNLPFISKILEKVVDVRIENHLKNNELHEVNQSAYRKFHSTETALLKVQNDILQSLDRNNVTILVMLDLSAAFDTIDHETLLTRLEHHFGITGTPLTWMRSYLSDRYQTVAINGELSDPVLMKYSVPQGSVLGPKNYTMYTKPVGAICRNHDLDNHFYADDSQLYLSFKPLNTISIEESVNRIEHCLNDIVKWMNNNMLKLNADKTELIIFSSEHNSKTVSNVSVTVDGSVIKQSPSVRNLGAYLDSNMKLDQHVNSVCRNSYAQLRHIGHIRPYLTLNATKSLVNSLVTSRIDYCNALLYGVPKQILNKLQTVQNTAARIVTRTARYDHITPVLQELHWLPVQCRVEYKILTHTFKALHDQSPAYIVDMLEIYRASRNLRSKNKSLTLVVPKCRTARYGDRSFQSASAKLWNALPSDIRDCNTLQSFKKALKTHYFKQYYGR